MNKFKKMICNLFSHKIRMEFKGAGRTEEMPEWMYELSCLRCGITELYSQSELVNRKINGKIVEVIE